ncbi:CBS domain-containing protein [Candidatus Micrarchaeota archaeon]|nr:CBS domain-containing protein [Candidatus Micrarchaeota archaeon]
MNNKTPSLLPELEEIKAKRKELGMTQTGLSKLSGVSQPLIAKIEAGKVIPSYENARKLFNSLGKISTESFVTAEEIMHFPLIHVNENESIERVIKLMNRHGISQIPVLMKNASIGVIAEETMIERISRRKSSTKAKEVMESSLPIIESSTEMAAISSLLNYNKAVLVRKKGRVAGIITKTDLIQRMVKAERKTRKKE